MGLAPSWFGHNRELFFFSLKMSLSATVPIAAFVACSVCRAGSSLTGSAQMACCLPLPAQFRRPGSSHRVTAHQAHHRL